MLRNRSDVLPFAQCKVQGSAIIFDAVVIRQSCCLPAVGSWIPAAPIPWNLLSRWFLSPFRTWEPQTTWPLMTRHLHSYVYTGCQSPNCWSSHTVFHVQVAIREEGGAVSLVDLPWVDGGRSRETPQLESRKPMNSKLWWSSSPGSGLYVSMDLWGVPFRILLYALVNSCFFPLLIGESM
jgi:hypothetical protein